jgi:methionyl-tRNA synthetase
LASGLGNLVARVSKLSQSLGVKKIRSEKNLILEYGNFLNISREKYRTSLNGFDFSSSLTSIWSLIKFCDQEVERNKLWQQSDRQKEIIGNLLFLIDEIAKLLAPILPETSEKILKNKIAGPLFPKI